MSHAQGSLDYTAEKNWEQVCQDAKARPLAPIEPSGPLSGLQLAHCDETALYYGLGEKPNYAAALQCGWFQRAHPQHSVGNMFYGPGVLMMLYANGKGVSRNYDLAIRFGCENDWAAEAESAYRIGHLEHLRATRSETTTFDLCDDITSGLSDGFCTGIHTRARDAVRAGAIATTLRKLSLSANSAFPLLQAAETEFEKARVNGEVDLSGTSRAAFQLREAGRLRDQFLINLQRFGDGDIPPASAADLHWLDQQLNEVYEQLQHSPAGKWPYGTIKPEGIRATERKWIALVDAWTAFARAAYPNPPVSRIRAQLIRLRLHQLRSLAKD
jgi:hypothetical protein